MVVFTCNHCGESLQKPRVEKHYAFTCRCEKFLTCVDCFKDFRGDEYNVHTKCITEEERYSGKDFVQKTKKGEVKQESWMEMIKSILLHENNLSHNYKNLLTTISYYNNVPRKKVKFINFIKSSTGGRTNTMDIEGIWDIIEKYKGQNALAKVSEDTNGNNSTERKNSAKSKQKSANSLDEEIMGNNENENTNREAGKDNSYQEGIENTLNSKGKKRKVKITIEDATNNGFEKLPKKKRCKSTNDSNIIKEEIVDEDNQLTENKVQSFSFSDHILQILTQKKSIQKKKLYKKILKEYKKFTGESITQEKLEKKINKKLRKMDNVATEDECINLIIEQ